MAGNRTVSNTERQPDPVPICPSLCNLPDRDEDILSSILLTYNVLPGLLQEAELPQESLAEKRQSLEPEPAKGSLSFWEEIYNCSTSFTGQATIVQWWMGPNLDQDYAEMCNSGPLPEP